MRRPRSDSISAQVATFRRAAEGLVEPPSHTHLPDAARPFWRSIISAKPEWSQADLEVAAILARCRADIEEQAGKLATEGYFVDGKPNPRHQLLEDLIRRSIALSRSVQVHSRARHGERRDQEPGREAARLARAMIADADDDLLARPWP